MAMKKFWLQIAGMAVIFAVGFTMGEQKGEAAAKGRVYEMRTYYANEGKLNDLLARFRNHTLKIFEKHGMKNVWYGVPQDSPASANTLVYLITHESREQAKKNWDAFRADPEWQKASKASEVNGKLVQKVEAVFLDSTDFSPMK
jgi:hypothetical protein